MSGVAVSCDFGGSRRVRPFVVMPLKPRTFGHQPPINAFDGVPTDFRPIRATDSARVPAPVACPPKHTPSTGTPARSAARSMAISAPGPQQRGSIRGQGGAQGDDDIEAARVRELVHRDLVDEQDLVVIPGFSRTSYEQMATSPFDFPLSSRFDENDAVAVFDDVLVAPGERAGLSQRRIGDGVLFYASPICPETYLCANNNAVRVGCRFRHPTLTQGLAAQAVERAISTAILSWRAAIFSASLALAFCPPTSVLRMTRSALRAWARSRMASLRP